MAAAAAAAAAATAAAAASPARPVPRYDVVAARKHEAAAVVDHATADGCAAAENLKGFWVL